MTRRTRLFTKNASKPARRTVLYVDPDKSYAAALHGAWLQLRLADDLYILPDHKAALGSLNSARAEDDNAPLAAIVLDPDSTGEETGQFVREVRKHCGKNAVPIVFWSQNSETYSILEGHGVESVVKKPMVLRLIQVLHAACQLRVHHFHPFMGNISLLHSIPQPNVGVSL